MSRHRKYFASLLWQVLLLIFMVSVCRADHRIEFFERSIRPALVKYCYECHSVEAGKSKGGLRVDSHEALIQGGDSGPAIILGNPGESLLMTAIRYADPDYEMPPKGKLDEAIIADFEKWIKAGAPDPRKAASPVLVQSEIDVEAGREFWAFQPPVNLPDGSRRSIDEYISVKLQKEGLQSAEPAAPEVLVRRLFFTLTGLPPEPEELVPWTKRLGANVSQKAYRELVDHLLESPRYGERFGQHWLDVARYAESTGGDSNNLYQQAWRYRNYVIDSFNEDKPFNQMIREQLAGDLLPIANDLEWANNLVATGFLAVGQKLVGEVDTRKFFSDLVDEQIDVTTRAFLGLTVSCSRCHDHKSDPIPQADYYALAGIFRNTQTHYGLIKAQARQHATLLDVTGLGLPVGANKLSADEFAKLKQDKVDAFANMDDLMGRIRSDGEKVTRANLRRSRTQRDRAESVLQSYDGDGNPLTFVMGVQDRELSLDTRLLVRGELNKPGQLVPAGYLQVLSPKGRNSLPSTTEGSGRLHLAEWIASNGNPLTARVIVNRVWHWLFGQGLVYTVDDFGVTGQRPTHPELLDALAIQLVKSNWSIKQLVREMVLTQTWQQSSKFNANNFEIDPDNQFLWRVSPRRLEAEVIRDSLLHVAGNLDSTRPTISLLQPMGEGTVGQNVFEPEIRKITSNRRSIYLPRVRNVIPDALELYDAPDTSNVMGRRDTTTVPLQALFSMNSPFVQSQALAFADRISQKQNNVQINHAYLLAYGRMPDLKEKQLAREFVKEFRSATEGDEEELRRQAIIAYCHALMCAAEFRIIN